MTREAGPEPSSGALIPESARARLTDVRLWAVERPIDVPVRMAFGALGRRVMAVVEVVSSDGCAGFGETWANHPGWVLAEREATVANGVRPLLMGAELDLADPAVSIAAVHHTIIRCLWPLGRQWGAPGPVFQALSGADQALWDLAGRLRGLAVCELVGGQRRHRVAAYASGIGPEDVAGQTRRCREAGFAAVKLRLGFGAETDRANLVSARRALGEEGELLVDANQAWTLDEALSMSDALAAANVTWVEEPVADGGVDDWIAFHEATGLPVAVGENVYGRRAWSELLASPDVAVLQPDVSKQGGITELLWLCREAEAAGKRVEPHLYGGALAYAATLQVAACCPAVRRIELDIRPNPVRDDLLVDPPLVTEGEVTVPEGSGLGAELAAVEKWRFG